jgi:predicted aspartyl protease
VLSRFFLQLFLAASLLASFPVRAGTLGEIPFQYRDGFLWLKVCAAGQREPLNFLLDSGASSSVLNIQAARRLNVKLGSRQSVHGVHSQTIAYWVNGFKAETAGITLPESLLAIDLSGVSETVHQPIDGLLAQLSLLAAIFMIF